MIAIVVIGIDIQTELDGQMDVGHEGSGDNCAIAAAQLRGCRSFSHQFNILYIVCALLCPVLHLARVLILSFS